MLSHSNSHEISDLIGLAIISSTSDGTDADAEGETELLGEGDLDIDGETEALGDSDLDGDGEADAEGEDDLDADGETDGDTEAEGDPPISTFQ